MDSKKAVMNKLGILTIGKQTAVGDRKEEIAPALVLRSTGEDSYVVVKWMNEEDKIPTVIYDPEGHKGSIRNIKKLFTGFREADEHKAKRGKNSKE